LHHGALTPAQCEHILERFNASDKVVRDSLNDSQFQRPANPPTL
jgi:hypothetical protein